MFQSKASDDNHFKIQELPTCIVSWYSLSNSFPCLHYSPTKLLQLTLCWPPSCVVTMPRLGPVICCMPLLAYPQIWSCFQLAPPSTEDFVPYNSGGPSWASLRLIFETSAALLWVFRFVALSTLLRGAFLSSLLPSPQLNRIHSGHFYSASSCPLLLGSARILCQSFTPKHHRQL